MRTPNPSLSSIDSIIPTSFALPYTPSLCDDEVQVPSPESSPSNAPTSLALPLSPSLAPQSSDDFPEILPTTPTSQLAFLAPPSSSPALSLDLTLTMPPFEIPTSKLPLLPCTLPPPFDPLCLPANHAPSLSTLGLPLVVLPASSTPHLGISRSRTWQPGVKV